MPLLFEVNDKDNILCFVPSGHFIDNEWVDLPPQFGDTCAFHTAYRLVTMCYTQTDITAKKSTLLTAINACKDKIARLSVINILCNNLLIKFFSKPKPLKDIQEAVQKLDLRYIKGLAAYDSLPEQAKAYIAEVFSSPENEIKMHCSKLVPQIFANLRSNTGNIEDLITTHFFEAQLAIFKDFFSIPEVKERVRDLDSKPSRTPTSLLEQLAVNRELLKVLFLSEYSFEVTALDLKKLATSKPSLKQALSAILKTFGPVMISGYVGTPFYDGAKPVSVGKLGSLELFGFPKTAYTSTTKDGREVDAHTVLVIGIMNEKVIYLDPTDASKVSGPRQAYIMSIDSFFAKASEFSAAACLPGMIINYINPKRFDTTPELMALQTGVVEINDAPKTRLAP